MTNWKYTVNFKDWWNSDIDISEKGELAAKELKKLTKYFDFNHELNDIIDDFKNCTNEQNFNSIMYQLYDWSDYNSIWIKTIF